MGKDIARGTRPPIRHAYVHTPSPNVRSLARSVQLHVPTLGGEFGLKEAVLAGEATLVFEGGVNDVRIAVEVGVIAAIWR